MPAKKHTVNKPEIPAVSPDPSLFPPVTTEASHSDTSLRLSPEVEVPAQTTPPSDSIAQLASLPNNPEPTTVTPAYQMAPDSSTPVPSPAKPKILWIIVIVALVLGLIIAGFAIYHLISSQKNTSTVSAVVAQPSPTPIPPTPTPAPTLNRVDLKVEVLNGSGTPGLAGKAKEYLEGLGYKDVATDNADSYGFATTEVSLKADKGLYQNLILSDLKDKYSLSEKTASLSADSSFDVIITLGQK